LLVLEGLARVVETSLTPAERIYPLPDPRIGPGEANGLLTKLREESRQASVPMVEAEALGWALQPSTLLCSHDGLGIRVNALGFRGPEIGELQPAEVRILTMGDSSIFGYGVAEAAVFSEVAAESLGSLWDRKVVSVNGAIPGYDSEQSLHLLATRAATVGPAWVVIGSMWSDIYRPDSKGKVASEARRQGRDLQWLATYRVMARLLARWTRPARVRWITSREDIGSGDRDARISLTGYAHNLEEMATYTESLGARPAFLMLPALMDFDLTPVPDSVMEYRDVMRQVARRHDAPLVDGPAVFADQGIGVTAFMDQVHPAVSGHALLGQALADVLAAVGPPPGQANRYHEPVGALIPRIQPQPGPPPALSVHKDCGLPPPAAEDLPGEPAVLSP